MRPIRRILLGAGFFALALMSAAVPLFVATVVDGDAPVVQRAAVAGVETTIAPKPQPTTRPASAERTVVGFLRALKSGDYARACDQLLEAAGCEQQLSQLNAGVTSFHVVGTKVRGKKATVTVVADGIRGHFELLKRSARWWISALAIE